jgi:spore maturation protein CgeB
MAPATARPAWLTPDRIVPVIVMFIGLFVVTYIFDAAFDRMGVNPASTLFNNFSIGYFGAAIILYYQIQAYRKLRTVRAAEKAELIAELNKYMRGELAAIGSSAALEDRGELLRRIEEAMSRIEARLANSAPAAVPAKIM